MSTHCYIGIVTRNGNSKKVDAIRCRNDGYLSGVGMTLLARYGDEATIRGLFTLGELFCLGVVPESNGSEGVAHFPSIKAMMQEPEEYIYLFDTVKSTWTVSEDGGPFVHLTDELCS